MAGKIITGFGSYLICTDQFAMIGLEVSFWYHKIVSLSIYLQKLGYLIINPFDGKIIAELTLFGKERIEFIRLTP
jgi:hypothetical protein